MRGRAAVVRPNLHIVRPLLALANAEKRIKGRDFKAEPWMIGEGPRFWNPSRVAELAAANEQLRLARKARK
mgnify:CR=1 FL=1